MAAQTCINAQHATLSGTTADSVTFSGNGTTICVTNRDAAVNLFFTPTRAATAVSLADDTFIVLPNSSKSISAGGALVISIVGNGNAYSAELW